MNLNAHYRLNDNVATTDVADASGNGYDGTAVRNTNLTYDAGVIDGGWHGNPGSNDYIDLGNPAFISDTAGTLAFWMNLDAIFGANGNYVLHAIGGTGNGMFSIRARRDANTTPNTRLMVLQRSDLGIMNIVGGSTNLIAGVDYHVVLTSNGSTWQFYLNGVAESMTVHAAANNGNWYGDTSLGGTPKMSLGDGYYAGAWSALRLDGLLDDVRIYNEALALWQIKSIYNFGKGTERYDPWRKTLGGVYQRRAA